MVLLGCESVVWSRFGSGFVSRAGRDGLLLSSRIDVGISSGVMSDLSGLLSSDALTPGIRAVSDSVEKVKS
jgi:hypothetical protein